MSFSFPKVPPKITSFVNDKKYYLIGIGVAVVLAVIAFT